MTTRRSALTLAAPAVLALGLCAPAPVGAQDIGSGFAGLSQKNNNEPVNIEADRLEVLDDKKYAIFSGEVKATQGKFILLAKQVKVIYTGGPSMPQKKGEQSGIKTIEASGKVAITTADGQSATSDWATYDVAGKIVTIGGSVVLSQAGNVMHGEKLVVDLNTNRSYFEATAETENQSKSKKPPRIQGVFMPGKLKQQGKDSAAGGSAPASAAEGMTARCSFIAAASRAAQECDGQQLSSVESGCRAAAEGI